MTISLANHEEDNAIAKSRSDSGVEFERLVSWRQPTEKAMIRERRYTIFKHTDIEKHLNENELALLCELESKVSFGRQQEGKGLLTAVVVEKDWPEYEPTWAMIESRVDGHKAS